MRPTDEEIVAMLYRASWVVQGVGAPLTPEERKELAWDMRGLAGQFSVKQSPIMSGAAEYYRPGVYNGD
jgi:hypothetical protein